MEYIAEALNEVLKPQQHIIVLLETMARKGSEVGSHKNRHQKLGQGCLGWEAFGWICRGDRGAESPLYLLTRALYLRIGLLGDGLRRRRERK